MNKAEPVPGIRWDPLLEWLFDIRDTFRYHGRTWHKWNDLTCSVMDAMMSVVAGRKVKVVEIDDIKGILVEDDK